MAPALHSSHNISDYGAFGDAFAPGEVLPGERIGPPLARRRRKTILRAGALLLAASGGGWALLDDRAAWRAWGPEVVAALTPLIAAVSAPAAPPMATDRKPLGAGVPIASAMSMNAPAPKEDAPIVAASRPKPAAPDAPPSISPSLASPPPGSVGAGEMARASASPLTTAALPPAGTGHGAGSQPLPPSAPDPSDPYQVRAAAVGLHPGLSRVLLARLSPADYRNAGIAIEKALSAGSSDAVFAWPQRRTADLALFKIHFVAGAAPDCRRYVVTIIKDRWSTTAQPMEKCAIEHAQPKRITQRQR